MTPVVPAPITAFVSQFPLKTNPPIKTINKTKITAPTLWISPPQPNYEPLLSRDVECLKWQAYIALRGLNGVKLRWDVAPEGCLDGSLPNLHIQHPELKSGTEKDELLSAQSILAWVNKHPGVHTTADPLEGYKNQEAKIESKAWISLLEQVVHAALLVVQPPPSYWRSIVFPQSMLSLSDSLRKVLSPPPARIAGLCSFLPAPIPGVRINTTSVMSRYKEAISSLSLRLGTDKWFLGSTEPTLLDAFAFAYIYSILHSSSNLRIEISRHANLVAWELKVRRLVSETFAM